MYRKPVIIETEDLAEGVYAASGSGSVTWAPGTKNTWPGGENVNFTVSIPSQYVGKHVKLTVTFDQAVSGAWGLDASATLNGSVLTLEHWNVPQTGTVTVSQNSNADIQITSIKIELV
jgi:hypothetical protein